MNNDRPDRELIREYLLGRLDNKKELEEQLSHDICVNDELSEMVESVEEEIIEDFLDETLEPADKNAVDGYFLRPPERREKLRFARLVRHHFEQREDLVNTRRETFDPTNVHPEGIQYRSAIVGKFHIRTYVELATFILLTAVGLTYISGIRKSQARLEGQLAQERQQYATVARKTQATQASMVALTLVSDRSRGDGTQIPNIEIKPSTQRIVVEIALQGRSSGPYDVMLEAQGKNEPIWAARLLPLVSASGDARLVFDMPAQGLASDVYSFVVSSSLPESGRPKHYDFRIAVGK
jgi:hypothetical protein